MPRKCNFGRVNSEGWFYITTIGNLLSSIIHRHVNAWNKHVQYIPYHTPNHQRIYKGSHDQERRTRSINGKRAAKGELTSTDGLIYIRRLIGHPQLSIKIPMSQWACMENAMKNQGAMAVIAPCIYGSWINQVLPADPPSYCLFITNSQEENLNISRYFFIRGEFDPQDQSLLHALPLGNTFYI